jgi:hypothetical protein
MTTTKKFNRYSTAAGHYGNLMYVGSFIWEGFVFGFSFSVSCNLTTHSTGIQPTTHSTVIQPHDPFHCHPTSRPIPLPSNLTAHSTVIQPHGPFHCHPTSRPIPLASNLTAHSTVIQPHGQFHCHPTSRPIPLSSPLAECRFSRSVTKHLSFKYEIHIAYRYIKCLLVGDFRIPWRDTV